jgi:NADPH:quinone reductase-like Zn-dependent oxidoreductase
MNMLESMSHEEAASYPTVSVTAYYALVEMGRLQPDETILIHGGAGGTGQFRIQLAPLIGAEVHCIQIRVHKLRKTF